MKISKNDMRGTERTTMLPCEIPLRRPPWLIFLECSEWCSVLLKNIKSGPSSRIHSSSSCCGGLLGKVALSLKANRYRTKATILYIINQKRTWSKVKRKSEGSIKKKIANGTIWPELQSSFKHQRWKLIMLGLLAPNVLYNCQMVRLIFNPSHEVLQGKWRQLLP